MMYFLLSCCFMAQPSLMAVKETLRPTPFCSIIVLDQEALSEVDGAGEAKDFCEAKPDDSWCVCGVCERENEERDRGGRAEERERRGSERKKKVREGEKKRDTCTTLYNTHGVS